MKTKKLLKSVLCLGAAFALAASVNVYSNSATSVKAEEGSTVFDENNIKYTFASISDEHIGYGQDSQMLRDALNCLRLSSPRKIDAIVSSGDQTRDGKKAQAQEFISILKEQFDPTVTPFVLANGNHDTYWTGCMTTGEFVDAYGEDVFTFDVDKNSIYDGNRHVVHNGYHFLTVQIMTFMPGYNTLKDTTKEWLKNTLDSIVEQDPDSYVFITCHSAAKDTVYGSAGNSYLGNWGASKELDDILKNYPQALLISGHTHCLINDERNIMQTTYTQINAGSTCDGVPEDYNTSGGFSMVTNSSDANIPGRTYGQGMLFDIDANGNIRITRYDFKTGKVIKQAWYLSAPKADKSHLTSYSMSGRQAVNVAPSFADDAKITVTETSATSIKISVPAAIDDDMVYNYNIVVKNSAAETVYRYNSYSEWYNYPNLVALPKTHDFNIVNFTQEYPYMVFVTAYDSFGVASQTLTLSVTDTKEQDMELAAELDARISKLPAAADLAESDLAELKAIREILNNASYKVKGFMTKISEFYTKEAGYYNKFYANADSEKYAPAVSQTFTNIAVASRGAITASEYNGVHMTWNSTTKNNVHGFNRTYRLDGLHLSLTNMEITSTNKCLGIIISNTMKDKWLDNECLLVYIDFASGQVYVNKDLSIGSSDLLIYENLGATPFDVHFEKVEGGYNLTITTITGSASFKIKEDQLKGHVNLTDETKCYVSLSTWSMQTSLSLDVAAIHDGNDKCLVYGADDPDEGGDGASSDVQTSGSEQTSTTSKGCKGAMGATSAMCMLAMLSGMAIIRKRNNK